LCGSMAANVFLFIAPAPLPRSQTESLQVRPRSHAASGRQESNSRVKQKQEELRRRLAEHTVAIPPSVAEKVSIGGLLDDWKLTEKLVQALRLTEEERLKVEQIAFNYRSEISGFLVKNSTVERDSTGVAWITTPDISVAGYELRNAAFKAFRSALGSARGRNLEGLLSKYSIFDISPIQTRFTIAEQEGQTVVHIEELYGGKVLGGGYEIGTQNIRRQFGPVIDHFAHELRQTANIPDPEILPRSPSN